VLTLQIPIDLLRRLERELARAGRIEIGGVLMGEHVSKDCFKLLDFSVQRQGGSGACFTRDPAYHRPFLDRFFEKTGHNYQRFNYLGEWHSHPSFPIDPSTMDRQTMSELLSDPEQNAAFALLLICRLDPGPRLALGVSAFQVGRSAVPVAISVTASERRPGLWAALKGFMS